MSQPPKHTHNLSMMLSEVLQDIGVTETMVMKEKRAWMIIEAIDNTGYSLVDRKFTSHFFGSHSEASTTRGLCSDIDLLSYNHDIKVIQDLSQWKPDMLQYLMVQDETVSPGYCLLQRLRRDAPLPEHDIQEKHLRTDIGGRVLLRNSMFKEYLEGATIHGPARSTTSPGGYDIDLVFGLHCPSWPKEATLWLQKQYISGWPTENMKRYSAEQGCFVVPVGSKQGMYQDLEWRISTSMAERCLMHSLNITQIGCFILMKMVLKTFLKPRCGEAVSSFMCKNILFHCISSSEVNRTWNEGSLLTWFNQCLQILLQCIKTENCPHFVIPRNNILAGKLSAEVKRQLVDVMYIITGNIEQFLLAIQIDDLGRRLRVKLGGKSTVSLTPADHNAFLTAHSLMNNIALRLLQCIRLVQRKIHQIGDANFQDFIQSIFNKLYQLYYREGSEFEKVAVSLLIPFLSTTIGSIRASVDIHHSWNISTDALKSLSLGWDSDVSSSLLKQASALYCAGDLQSCEIILADLAETISHTRVHSMCCCNRQPKELHSIAFGKLCYEKNEDMIKQNMAMCVTYLQCEVNCIPCQLKYDMFRSTKEDRPYRGRNDYWMDWAIIDPIPYLYFLQYNVYSHLHRPADQHRALENLARTIETDPDLGHKETAINLLGQCVEQKNWLKLALYFYKMSLTLRGRNNAANWHVCRLLGRLLRSRSQ